MSLRKSWGKLPCGKPEEKIASSINHFNFSRIKSLFFGKNRQVFFEPLTCGSIWKKGSEKGYPIRV